MNPLLNLLNAYRRVRHSYGFGVHSPAAYSMVRNVIMDSRGYSYYDFDRLESLADSRKERQRARILHRLASRHPYSALITDTEIPKAWRAAVKREYPCPTGSPLIISQSMPEVLPKRGILFIYNLLQEDIEDLKRTLRYGVLLHGRDAVLIISNPAIHFVDYSILL